MIGDYPRRAGASSDAGEMDLIPVGRILFSSCLCGVMLCCVVGTSVSVVLRIAFAKAVRNGPRPGSLSPKRPEMDLAPGYFRQSNPKWTSPRITFAKAARNGPRPGSLSPKQPEMDLAPGHFRQSSPKWTSPRVTFVKTTRNGPQKAFVIPRSLHPAGRSGKIQLSPQPASLPFRMAYGSLPQPMRMTADSKASRSRVDLPRVLLR